MAKKLIKYKKEYDERFTSDGSFKVRGDCDEVWEWIESTIRSDREETLMGFVSWFNQKDIDGVEVLVDFGEIKKYLSQTKEGNE